MKYKYTETISCNVCGKPFERSFGQIVCPECEKDREKSLNRIFTKDTVFLVCKWYNEGDSVRKIASVLKRSEENVRLALKKGGAL